MPRGFELSCSALLRLIVVFQRLLKSSLSPLLHDFRDISDNDIRDVSTQISVIHSILPPLLSEITFHL